MNGSIESALGVLTKHFINQIKCVDLDTLDKKNIMPSNILNVKDFVVR